MSKKNKISKPTGGHTPVSNQDEAGILDIESDFFVTNPVSEEPSGGKDHKIDKTNKDVTEAVVGKKNLLVQWM